MGDKSQVPRARNSINNNRSADSQRLLILSNENKNSHFLGNITKKNVKKAIYQYESSSLDDILAIIIAELAGLQVETIAFILHGNEKEMFLAGVGNMVLSSKALAEEQNLREFFMCLFSTFMTNAHAGCRVDFLDCTIKEESEGKRIAQELRKIIKCPVGIACDLYGPSINIDLKTGIEPKYVPVGEMYFHPEELKDLLNLSLRSQIQNLSGYEKVRTVGKGAFGTAVLYRKKDDDSLVIVKEINMHDLTASERQLAINEVSVLSMLNHENIVSYFDSFEEDGVLMIEMEYADGGTLAQYLSQIKSPVEEREILQLFKQIVSAIKHMHDHNILHRDLKTANIFLTKEGIVKVGDFGISKMLNTRQGGAITVVGTPYYISPEMCEGKFYNQKSDIWALGCILYEMACQQKTFEGSNLPALVNKIVKGQFAPVKGNYSLGFKQLIRDMLQRDPDLRPTAAEILDIRLYDLLKDYEDSSNKDYDDTEISMDFNYQGLPPVTKNTMKQPRSVLYDVKMHLADISLTPIPLPPRSKIKEVSLSSTHMIALTSELLCYTWGDGRKGQLGHGELETWREKPTCVEALKGKNITRICAGEGFSVFSSDNGIVMTCGSGSQGCLGHGDWNMCVKPKLIEKLLSVDVSAVSCGPHHVVVVGGDGEAYAWGCGSGGRLGTGTENDCCVPTEVKFFSDVRITNAYCGFDGTMFVTDTGSLLACGRNDFNKLGLNEQRGFLSQMRNFIAKTEVEKQVLPSKLGWLRQRVVSVSMGITHTAVLVEPGKLITFGLNKSGQLGRGNLRNHSSPSIVKSMGDRTVTMVQCGDTFTVAGTSENAVYFWGSRQVLISSLFKPSLNGGSSNSHFENARPVKNNKKPCDADYPSEISEVSVSEVIKIGESNSPLMREVERIGPDSPIIQVKTPEVLTNETPAFPSSGQHKVYDHMNDYRENLADSCTGRRDVILQPQEILALYASPAQIAKGEMVSLANLYCYGSQVYLVVDTTAPLPRHHKKSKAVDCAPSTNIPSNNSPQWEKKYSIPDEDSLGPIPEWLKMELANATTPATSHNSENAEKYTTLDKEGHNLVSFPQEENNNLQAAKNFDKSLTNGEKEYIKEAVLREELERISNEKKQAEERLHKLEEMVFPKNNVISSQAIFQEREKELEKEILKLKEELERHKRYPGDGGVELNELKLFAERSSREEKVANKRGFWSWPRRRHKIKTRSSICSLL